MRSFELEIEPVEWRVVFLLPLSRQKQKDDVEGEKTSEKHKKVKTPNIQNIEKKCIQISKFYVLFAHLFSCIISTIHPSSSSLKKKEKTNSLQIYICSLRFCKKYFFQLFTIIKNEKIKCCSSTKVGHIVTSCYETNLLFQNILLQEFVVKSLQDGKK